jgi:hypothetical protein
LNRLHRDRYLSPAEEASSHHKDVRTVRARAEPDAFDYTDTATIEELHPKTLAVPKPVLQVTRAAEAAEESAFHTRGIAHRSPNHAVEAYVGARTTTVREPTERPTGRAVAMA